MRALTEPQCLALLDSVRVGRLALTDRALPIIVPVAFARMDNDLIFRVEPGAASNAADMGQVVCFEADWASVDFDTTWSVTAVGQLFTLDEPGRIGRAERLGLVRWSGQCDTFVGMRPHMIDGRQRSLEIKSADCDARPDVLRTQQPRSDGSSPSCSAGC